MAPNCDRTILDSVREVVRSREFRKFVRHNPGLLEFTISYLNDTNMTKTTLTNSKPYMNKYYTVWYSSE